MASSSILCFLLAVFLLAAGAYSRPGVHFHPCKTLYISYTFTSSETFGPSQIRAGGSYSSSSSGGGIYSVFRIVHPVRPLSSTAAFAMPIRDLRPMVERPRLAAATEGIPAEPSFGISSLQERAKDILVVVAGLLFGVGCGALTGAIMYLAWSLFTNQYEICGSGYGEDEEEDESPKKLGYVKIAGPVPAKEGYEGN
ncbi:hypothetical protein AXF42_Ash015865 [Apostasia shenzhenica]|uniref:Uncharacterized protein n=1 Tax=Apostasia shenzhenica TaxID=1088818 RepID=A0A2H9ZXW1_9ASPA|nr:hypothetical protein AXF42_Ash015865 [Apostasia shenzhenica]